MRAKTVVYVGRPADSPSVISAALIMNKLLRGLQAGWMLSNAAGRRAIAGLLSVFGPDYGNRADIHRRRTAQIVRKT